MKTSILNNALKRAVGDAFAAVRRGERALREESALGEVQDASEVGLSEEKPPEPLSASSTPARVAERKPALAVALATDSNLATREGMDRHQSSAEDGRSQPTMKIEKM
ncbi:unnamed protein product [Phytophthora lilii]|uniref:Unnamed protein product n=1 Tax=Phytophthora lilii TaxID=2077276 RepID=A0A9W7D978_9STRA|nr:unnamed protein product [Phytophthora lilii]